MKVVVCGAGQVGFNIARYLASENNDVTVIDQSPELIGKINESLDVQALVGHASHPDLLESAGVADADMLIAVTYADEVNLVARLEERGVGKEWVSPCRSRWARYH